jgi:hypothetical protein
MPNESCALSMKPVSPASDPAFHGVARLPEHPVPPAPSHARFSAIHRQHAGPSLAKIAMAAEKRFECFPLCTVSAVRAMARRYHASGRVPLARHGFRAEICSSIEYSPHKEITMDKTTKPATFQHAGTPSRTNKPANSGRSEAQATPLPGRCAEKGCVFPACRPDSEFCVHHRRQEMEPTLFRSWQPTWLLIHRATGPDGSGSRRGRVHDRFRLAAQSKAFQQGRV